MQLDGKHQTATGWQTNPWVKIELKACFDSILTHGLVFLAFCFAHKRSHLIFWIKFVIISI